MSNGDEAFLSAFTDYVKLLGKESIREMAGEKSISSPVLDGASAVLIESSKGLEISDLVGNLVEQVSDLVENKMLAPRTEEEYVTSSQNSINDVKKTLQRFRQYFKSRGVMLYTDIAELDEGLVLDVYFGEATELAGPGGFNIVIFNNMRAGPASYEMMSGVDFDESGFKGARVAGKSLHSLEQFIRDGNEEWARLSDKAGLSKEEFLKDYVETKIWYSYIHEFFHEKMQKNRLEPIVENELQYYSTYRCVLPNEFLWDMVGEAGAQLYTLFRGTDPDGTLGDLYLWRDGDIELYAKAAEMAFRCLEGANHASEALELLEEIRDYSQYFYKFKNRERELGLTDDSFGKYRQELHTEMAGMIEEKCSNAQ